MNHDSDNPSPSPGHLLGTCRMGKDPKASVVGPDHRSHDVPNLFICDGSSMVTSGRGQPTMTIMALAFRAGERDRGPGSARGDLTPLRHTLRTLPRLAGVEPAP